MSYLKNPSNQARYLWLFYQYDVLSVQQIASLLELTPSTCQEYLSALKDAGYVMNLRVGNIHYWHMLPKGMGRLASILGIQLSSKATTLPQNAENKHNLKHDAHCTNAIMRMIETSIDGECGLFDWYGPTQTLTLYAYRREGENFLRRDYQPDALISFYAHGKWGFFDIELDTGSQKTEDWYEKAIKARKRFHINEKCGTRYRVVAFITLKSEQRKWNIVNSLREFCTGNAPLLVIATTYQELMEHGISSPIWATNNDEFRCCHLSDLVKQEWDYEEPPLFIGTAKWRESLNNGDLYIFD